MVERPHIGWWISIFLGMGLTTALAVSDGVYGWWHEHVTTLLSQGLIQVIAVAAWAAHVGEGIAAHRLASRLGPGTDVMGWAIQTTLLGFPSLKLLKKRAAG
ncbi:MAG: DUF4499 domain-containing protein [Deltaproteobacteria bacterium]|nr:DUF4499 domain-containing protein [Deltaproteobacteria bacterium]